MNRKLALTIVEPLSKLSLVMADLAQRTFCPTGQGGGVDNSCGSGGGGSGAAGKGGWSGHGADVDAKLEGIAKKELFIDKLETRNADHLDFHNVGVLGVKDALHSSYKLGSGGKGPGKKDSKKIEGIAKSKLFIGTLEERRSDRLDFHDVAVWGVRDALSSAYSLGKASKKS